MTEITETSDEKSLFRKKSALIKSRLIALADEQKLDKTSLRQDHRVLKEPDAPHLQFRVVSRAATITAHLNYYNALRGKPWRHNVPDHYLFYYVPSYNGLLKEFGEIEG